MAKLQEHKEVYYISISQLLQKRGNGEVCLPPCGGLLFAEELIRLFPGHDSARHTKLSSSPSDPPRPRKSRRHASGAGWSSPPDRVTAMAGQLPVQ